MKAEIITIGDEILIGQIIDSNSAFIAEQLSNIGIQTVQITSISDNKQHIINALEEAGQRAGLIILTGGLGPTNDDITKKTITEYFGTKLKFNDKVFNHVKQLLVGRGIEVSEINAQQAQIPENAEILFNNVGTAPGMLFKQNNKIYVSMPGVPFEMKFIVEKRLIPYLQKNISTDEIVKKTVMTQGIPESHLATKIKHWEDNLPEYIKLAYLPQPGIVRLRLSAKGKDKNKLTTEINNEIEKLKQIIPEAIFGYNDISIEQVINNLLKQTSKNLATAESCTGGTIAAMITSIAGSSQIFKGSIVAYSNEAKHKILGVKTSTLETYGAVSKQVVEEMADGVFNLFNTDYAITVSGIAGPTGGTPEKPIGTTWICVAHKNGEKITRKYLFGEHRGRNIRRSALTALNTLRNIILTHSF
jgi:nicotinamide-nucleotide amidase